MVFMLIAIPIAALVGSELIKNMTESTEDEKDAATGVLNLILIFTWILIALGAGLYEK